MNDILFISIIWLVHFHLISCCLKTNGSSSIRNNYQSEFNHHRDERAVLFPSASTVGVRINFVKIKVVLY